MQFNIWTIVRLLVKEINNDKQKQHTKEEEANSYISAWHSVSRSTSLPTGVHDTRIAVTSRPRQSLKDRNMQHVARRISQ